MSNEQTQRVRRVMGIRAERRKNSTLSAGGSFLESVLDLRSLWEFLVDVLRARALLPWVGWKKWVKLITNKISWCYIRDKFLNPGEVCEHGNFETGDYFRCKAMCFWIKKSLKNMQELPLIFETWGLKCGPKSRRIPPPCWQRFLGYRASEFHEVDTRTGIQYLVQYFNIKKM